MYVSGTTTYRALSHPNHLRGLRLDKLVETQAAHLNSNYYQLIAQYSLYSKK